jgi:hypothetical protein
MDLIKEVLRLTKDERFTAGGVINLVGLAFSAVILLPVFAVPVVVLVVRTVKIDMAPVHLVPVNNPAADLLVILILFVLFMLYGVVCAHMYDGYTLIRRSRRRPPQ